MKHKVSMHTCQTCHRAQLSILTQPRAHQNLPGLRARCEAGPSASRDTLQPTPQAPHALPNQPWPQNQRLLATGPFNRQAETGIAPQARSKLGGRCRAPLTISSRPQAQARPVPRDIRPRAQAKPVLVSCFSLLSLTAGFRHCHSVPNVRR